MKAGLGWDGWEIYRNFHFGGYTIRWKNKISISKKMA